MGAYLRFFEKRIERELRANASKGVPVAPRNGSTPFQLGYGPKDRRALIPPLGLREYWYPALPAGKVGRKPLFWVLLGDELVFFHDREGQVMALTDICPHRGASLAQGDCFYRGFVTCPYHGATFDGDGSCVAFITEGPDSRMVGRLRARSYPTKTLRGWVFVWMGEEEPAPIEEDAPPEFFEPETTVMLSTYTYWYTNWMVAIENQNDAHNTFFVHRNSFKQLTGINTGRVRTPLGPRSRIVNGRAVLAEGTNRTYYAGPDGRAPYQMYYPGVDGVWPLHRWRRLWRWFFMLFARRRQRYETPEEWSGAHHLPGMVRVNYGSHMYTRWAVPVTENLSRIVFFHSTRPASWLGKAYERVHFTLFHNWVQNYNFSTQDNAVASPVRYAAPERLAATDSHLIVLRKLVTEHSRDALKRKRAGEQREVDGETPAEEHAYEVQRELGVTAETEVKSSSGRTSTPAHWA